MIIFSQTKLKLNELRGKLFREFGIHTKNYAQSSKLGVVWLSVAAMLDFVTVVHKKNHCQYLKSKPHPFFHMIFYVLMFFYVHKLFYVLMFFYVLFYVHASQADATSKSMTD